MTAEKEIVTLQEAGLPVNMDQMLADSGMGGEMSLKDIAIPFLYILQSLSPQANAENPRYIKGATSGMLYLTVREEIFEGREHGITIVPCYYTRALVEWKPRESGGGIVASYAPDDKIMGTTKRNDKGVPVLPNGNVLIETSYQYVLVKSGDTWVQAIFPMKSTALKASRKMNSLISTLTIPGTVKPAPRFLRMWNLKTERQQKQDNIWAAPVLTVGPVVPSDVYFAAKAYCEIAAKGILSLVETDTDTAASSTVAEDGNIL